MAKRTKDDELKSYILELSNGNLRRIKIPADWKVTYGPVAPPRKGNSRNGFAPSDHSGWTHALRVYEGAQQRAIYTDVVSFRDESIPTEERVTEVKQQVLRKQTPAGMKDVIVEGRVTEWRDPMAPMSKDDRKFLADITDDDV